MSEFQGLWEAEPYNKSWTRMERFEDGLNILLNNMEQEIPDIQTFIENLKIVNKQGELVSLIMNRSQEIVFHKLLEARENRKPARFICLKARQLGITTLIEAYIFALVTMRRNRFALVAAGSIESAATIFAITHRFYNNLKFKGVTSPSRNSLKTLEYSPPHYSRMRISTASNKELGRGETLHYVHASEVAFWDQPEAPMLSINQSVPQHWDTMIFWESTANGLQNLFHRTWLAANRGESDMTPIFLSWKDFPEYSLPCAYRERLNLTQDEKDYKKNHKLTREQIKWARHTKVNQCHDSWSKFHQEYPVAAHLAFIHTGMPWFNGEALNRMLEEVAEPSNFKGFLTCDESLPLEPKFQEDPSGPLEIWKKPDTGKTYCLGMDVGEGVGGDYTVIQVICNETGEVAAKYRSNRIRAETAGVDAYLLATYYNHGLLGIERNGPGLATLAVCERGLADYPQLTGYPNLYYHTLTDRKAPEETRRLGWITDRKSKEAMLNRLARAVEEDELIIYSKEAILEMQGFIWDAETKVFRQNYKAPGSKISHDDEIMALAIANEMRIADWESRFIQGPFSSDSDF